MIDISSLGSANRSWMPIRQTLLSTNKTTFWTFKGRLTAATQWTEPPESSFNGLTRANCESFPHFRHLLVCFCWHRIRRISCNISPCLLCIVQELTGAHNTVFHVFHTILAPCLPWNPEVLKLTNKREAKRLVKRRNTREPLGGTR